MSTQKRTVEFFRHDLAEDELASLAKTVASVFITLGPRVAEFESVLGAYIGVPHVVGVNGCTNGLLLSVRALDIGRGDEVITTPMTFISTPNAALYVGAKPVFVDVDPSTGLIDPDAVEAAITPRTKAIIAVHLYGQMADVRRLREIADRHHLALIEDSAHGTEMRRDGIAPGQLSDMAVFSFYATKTMTCGDGGAIATKNPALADRLRRLRNHGVSKDAASRYGGAYKHWDMMELGYKAAMTDVDAALLIPQIPKLDDRRAKRQALVERYEKLLEGETHTRLLRWSGTSSHHLFTVLSPRGHRDEVIGLLGQQGIGAAINYRAIPTLTYYRERFGFEPGMFPHAEEIGDRTISLPLYPTMKLDDVDYVVEKYREIVTELVR